MQTGSGGGKDVVMETREMDTTNYNFFEVGGSCSVAQAQSHVAQTSSAFLLVLGLQI